MKRIGQSFGKKLNVLNEMPIERVRIDNVYEVLYVNPNQPIDPNEFAQLMLDLQDILSDPSAYQAFCQEKDAAFPGWLYGLEPHHQN